MKIKKIIAPLFLAVTFAIMASKVLESSEKIMNISWKGTAPTNTILLCSILLIPIVNAFSWHVITKGLSAKIKFRDNLELWTLSNTVRFMPGGFWQYPGRIYMASSKGMAKTITIAAILLETIFNLTIGANIIALSLLFNASQFRLPIDKTFLIATSALGILFISAFMSSRFTSWILSLANKVLKKDKGDMKINLSKKWLPIIVFSVIAQFALAGLVLYILGIAMDTGSSTPNLFSSVSTFASSWIIGYITFVAPAGLGVQDASMTALLSTNFDTGVAVIISLLHRSLLLLGEFAIVVGLILLRRRLALRE